MTSAEQLFYAARRGDRKAFESLVEIFRPDLANFCRRRMGETLQKAVDVEDILQETSLKALSAIEGVNWQGDRALFNWFCGIALNVIYAHSRRCLRIAPLADGFDATDGIGTSPSQAIRREERFERLERSLSTLSDDQQRVIRMVRIEGMSVREAAALIGRSEKTTYQLLWRALKKLREVFGDTASLRLPTSRSLKSEDELGAD